MRCNDHTTIGSWLGVAALIMTSAGCANTNLPANADGQTTISPSTLPTAASADGGSSMPTCPSFNPQRNAYFGELHLHTAYSFDAYTGGTRLDPAQSYVFATAGEVTTPLNTRVKLRRPLDFAAATDHSDWLGWSMFGAGTSNCPALCRGATASPGNIIDYLTSSWIGITCLRLGYCQQAVQTAWSKTQQAAHQAYEPCSFTTFAAFEWSGAKVESLAAPYTPLHRNVIFRNEHVISAPIPFVTQPTRDGLWQQLIRECLDAGTGCDVLAIPHNSNTSLGHEFMVEDFSTEQMARKARLEPLVEIHQEKGESECYPGVSATDPLCDFEKLFFPGCAGKATDPSYCWGGLVRYGLGNGLVAEQRLGINPFKQGFIGSTDTHTGLPGSVDEDQGGQAMAQSQDTLIQTLSQSLLANSVNPGGLAAVWAEQNTRDSIFASLRRRETYATSGPRIKVRFFGGWDYPPDLCGRPDLVSAGYAGGVPMGGDLPPRSGTQAPRFVVSALRDPGTSDMPGTQLQRIQIIKVALSAGADAAKSERVYEVAGNPQNGASVNTSTCARSGVGADGLCTVWTDPDFRLDQRAVYYARVVENPSCRWTAHVCNAIPKEKRPPGCSNGSVRLITQERAWTSPIWYHPAGGVSP